MKQIYLLCAWICTVLASGCQYDALPKYSGETQIYFSFADESKRQNITDSTTVNFGYDRPVKQDSICRIPVRIQGNMTDYDREIAFEIDPEASNVVVGTHVELLPSIIPAASVQGFVGIRLKNNTDINGQDMLAVVRLVANAHFRVDYVKTKFTDINDAALMESTKFKIHFNNKADIPNLWAANLADCENYFGKYSEKKLDLICEVSRMPYESFFFNPATEVASEVYNERFPVSTKVLICRAMNRYIAAYPSEHNGELYLEEDGTPMELGPTGKKYK